MNTKLIKKLNTALKNRVNETNGKNKKKVNNSFINLSSYILKENEIKFLNIGFNFPIQSRYSKLTKEVEIEKLFESIIDLHDKNEVEIKENIPDLLRAEASKHRNVNVNSIITVELRKAAEDLKNNNKIVIRRADKASYYVILDKEDYFNKIDLILNDKKKFKPMKTNITNTIKKKANTIISAVNAVKNDMKL